MDTRSGASQDQRETEQKTVEEYREKAEEVIEPAPAQKTGPGVFYILTNPLFESRPAVQK